jgi:hypothetical protein
MDDDGQLGLSDDDELIPSDDGQLLMTKDDRLAVTRDGRWRRRKWEVWHGSKEFLIRVARVAERCVAERCVADRVCNTADSVQLLVKVGSDCEEFTTIDDFERFVTPEALRSFNAIDVDVGDRSKLRINIYFEREGMVLRTGRAGLIVESGDKQVAKEADARLKAVLDRGYTRFDRAARQPESALVFGGVLGILIASGLKALLSNTATPSWVYFLCGVAGIPAWYALLALVPVVEIAPLGQTRFERATRVVFSVALGVATAGLANLIYG